ncbi:MAG: endopeptidase La [Candidatus Dormibacteraeota bacterium]|uniref:Lon protease n=1 Tax=Candidatus Aeolococcus gillhamiae TaxID=3127015 RepID=A0A934JUE2_9BACT|nr:endopeptidase La [Candidatus Dormibacteraeota bacterium]
MAELTSELLPILQLDDVVVLPGMTVTLAIEGDTQRAAVAAAQKGNRLLLLVPHVGGAFSSIGTVAQVVESGQLPTGADVSIFKGLHRARLGGGQSDIGGALWVQVEPLADGEPTDAARELAREYRALIENLLESRGAGRVIEAVRSVRHPGHLADLAGYSPDLSVEQRVEVLETIDIEARLTRLIAWTKDILADASVREKIRTEVNEGMEKTQRDYLLRQQLEAIKKQLGEGGDDVAAGYRERLENAGMPDDVRKEVEREVDRFERTSEQNPEHGWIRTYLDWMFEIPWNVRSEDNFDLAEARRILDADHTGLDDVKQRIIEFLAVRKLRHERGLTVLGGRGSGAIITLVGPPGVGKTSLGESVARALGRKFARVSLGGIHDEADIRGHRRTYVGALPGRIVRALKEAGTKNPVIMLDEIDKVGSDWRGDPSSALLEVLDPAQNNTFRDHYLEVDLDLSEVLFIPTANVWETIPAPLLDRMELIRLDGYTENEKVAIARDHLLRRQVTQAGLEPEEVSVTDPAILAVITDHTREAGVRNLERELGKMTRKVATKIATGELTPPFAITPAEVRELLGKPKFDNEVVERTSVAGVATGLAVTGTGGDVLFIEAATSEGDGKLTLTGQLGDVMKESAQIALSYVRAHAVELGIDPDAAQKSVHVHVPAGAVPKDGPSAGVAMTTALVSLLTGRPMRNTVAMTGEVTLQGLVLPIGGVKQKVLAAHRMGLTEVILPRRNEKDIDDVPESVREAMTFHLASRVEEAIAVALAPRATEAAAAA